jgi:hypothetical protein
MSWMQSGSWQAACSTGQHTHSPPLPCLAVCIKQCASSQCVLAVLSDEFSVMSSWVVGNMILLWRKCSRAACSHSMP